MSELSPYQTSIVVEHAEISTKLHDLGVFACGPDFRALDEKERTLLLRQGDAMTEYQTILFERMKAFGADADVPLKWRPLQETMTAWSKGWRPDGLSHRI